MPIYMHFESKKQDAPKLHIVLTFASLLQNEGPQTPD